MGRLKEATGTTTDCWLTPPELLKLLGPFDLDPCCPPIMPWRTAKLMLTNEVAEVSVLGGARPRYQSGLDLPWKGRVFCNPPYSAPLPWVQKMAAHGNGILLIGARGPETKWGSLALRTCDNVYFLGRRLSFHFQDGTVSKGKWQPNMLCAYGDLDGSNGAALERLKGTAYDGVLLERCK